MDSKIKATLETKLEALRTELAAQNRGALLDRIRAAEHARKVAHTQQGQMTAAGDLKNANAALASLDKRADDLRREIAAAEASLRLDERIESHRLAWQFAAEQSELAAAALRAAQDRVARLDDLIAAEVSADQAAVQEEGAAMLAALKSGGDAMAATAPRASKVHALRVAKATAEDEREEAKRVAAAGMAEVARQRLAYRSAQAELEGFCYELAQQDFVVAAGRYMGAKVRAKLGGINPGHEVFGLAMTALEADLAANGSE